MKSPIHSLLMPLLTAMLMIYSTPAAAQATNPTSGNDFEVLMSKIRKDFVKNPSIEKELEMYNPSDGSFTDVDYASTARTKWPPMVHLERLANFASAYTHPGNKAYKDEALFNKIEHGLAFWHQRNPWCHNWWYNQIAEPQCLGLLLIQMRTGEKQLPQELEEKLLERIRQDGGHPAKWTGANRTDIALHWIYRACLSEDRADLKTALDNAYSPLAYTTKEGFQHDNSYFQHGAQLYIGGYGDEILKGITQIAMYTKGTEYAVPEEKLAIMSRFMRETYYAGIRGQYMLFDLLGRGMSRPGATRKEHTALFARRMIELDPAHADEYRAIIERLSGKQPASYGLSPRHTHYFRGDYTLHIRPGYTFDVRMVSNRTMRCEYGNGENLKTYFLSDGCTNLVAGGGEYDRIFPVWNWTRIPGVTAPQTSTIPLAKSSWQTPGTSTFAGGVSDSLYGASAYAYTDTFPGANTGARKAWFFFDNEVVCLGAGIHSTAPERVNTTVNQCLLAGEKVTVCSRNRLTEMPGGGFDTVSSEEDFDAASPDWVLHNGIGYVFPQGGQVFISSRMQTGSWHDINQTASAEVQQQEVFTLGFDHGKQPVDAHYAYIVVPGKQTAKEMNAYQKEKEVEVLMNTKELQAVRHKQLGIWQLVFYRAGTFEHKGLTVKADKGCALMIKETGKRQAVLHIADPAQTETVIRLTIGRSGKTRQLDCDFRNSGVYAGKSQKHELAF